MSGSEIIPNRWVRFERAWDWVCPAFKPIGRVTKHFPVGFQARLTRAQYAAAISNGVAKPIENPRNFARTQKMGGDLLRPPP